jgi:hypothetical protein
MTIVLPERTNRVHETNGAGTAYHFDNVENPTIPNPAPITADPSKFLKVAGSDVTLDGKPILLRGACLGGWSESV